MKTSLSSLLLTVLISVLGTGCDSSPSTPGLPPNSSAKDGTGKTKVGAVAKQLETSNREVIAEKSVVGKDDPPSTTTARTEVEEEKEPAPEADPPIPEEWRALNKAKNLYFEKAADGTRRVHIVAEVALRDGPLEVLLCRNNTKEHESILRADLDAREIHTALIAAGAKYGTTVKFTPEYKSATGDTIKVTLTFNKDGKLQTKPAQSWIQHMRTKKPMEHEWVFAGSRFFKDPEKPDAPPFYCANNGEVISIANFPDSMLDLPVKSSKEESELGFSTITDRIPSLKTKVIVTLEPIKK